jgi:RNA polymerase sigma factor (sigma-70 family)
VDEREWLVGQFESNRSQLRAVALRMLGSGVEAEDAVQEAWLRLSRSDVSDVQNLGRWLTTVVARVCLDMLRSRTARREAPLDPSDIDAVDGPVHEGDPAQEAVLNDSVGLALLVVLDTLEPAERLAFVLHDVFAVPYAEIAPLVERSTAAAKMLASRARRRIRETDLITGSDDVRHRGIVQAFLAASRDGDFEALLALLDPDAVFRADQTGRQVGAPGDLHGAPAIAANFSGRALGTRLALINGAAGAVWAPGGKPRGAFAFTVADGRIVAIELVADPDHLARLDVTILTDGPS